MGFPTPFARTALTALVLLLAVAAAAPGPAADAAGPPSRTVTVLGAGPLTGGDQQAARTYAIRTAKAAAVALVTGELLPPDRLAARYGALDPAIFQQPDAFIEGYRVLGEMRTDTEVRVLVQATVSAGALEERLRSEGLVTGAGAGTSLAVTIEGAGNLPRFVQFRQSLAELDGVSDVQVQEMGVDRTVLTVQWQGSPDGFADALVRQRYDGFGIRVYETGENALRVELVNE